MNKLLLLKVPEKQEQNNKDILIIGQKKKKKTSILLTTPIKVLLQIQHYEVNSTVLAGNNKLTHSPSPTQIEWLIANGLT